MGQFTLRITLGSEWTKDGFDVAEALHRVAYDTPYADSGQIDDLDGNIIGEWELSK